MKDGVYLSKLKRFFFFFFTKRNGPMAGQTKGWVPDLQVVGWEQWRSHVEITCLQLPSLRRPPVLLEFSTEPSQLLFSSCTFLFSLCSLFLFSLSFKGAI